MDGPMIPCGTAVCTLPEICCITKVPLAARCIPLAEFEAQKCEKLELPCTTPRECPAGLVCCVAFSPVAGVTCRPAAFCPVSTGEGYIACGSDADCPSGLPGACVPIGSSDTGDVLSVCI